MTNKRLAIDSSIWLYQFQKAIRDPEGRGIINAHILGFLRRISKLLYYGIKPVFVFDGGLPTLKQHTINDRRKRKRGGRENLAKTAERLLAARLRTIAVTEAQRRAKAQATPGDLITDQTVYFDHPLSQDFADKNVTKKRTRVDPSPNRNSEAPAVLSPSKKPRFIPKDQYELPPIEKIDSVAQVDHRLATEQELKDFIHEFDPHDLDINSPQFQSLSTELKYEIIGDLRVKSRQPNKMRAEAMRKTNDLEFSQAQILNLKKRNELTQKLLVVTDMVGKANLTIPVKIAAQRNREYVLVKASEGWILGIENDRTTGTAERPVKLDPELEDEKEDEASRGIKIKESERLPTSGTDPALTDSDDDLEFEEVAAVPASALNPQVDREKREADLREAIRFHFGTKETGSMTALDIQASVPNKPPDEKDLFHRSAEEDEVMSDTIAEVALHPTFDRSNCNRTRSDRDLGEGSSKGTLLLNSGHDLVSDPGLKAPSNLGTDPLSSAVTQSLVPRQTIIDKVLRSIELEVDEAFESSSGMTPSKPDDQMISKLGSPDGMVVFEPDKSSNTRTAPTGELDHQVNQSSTFASRGISAPGNDSSTPSSSKLDQKVDDLLTGQDHSQVLEPHSGRPKTALSVDRQPDGSEKSSHQGSSTIRIDADDPQIRSTNPFDHLSRAESSQSADRSPTESDEDQPMHSILCPPGDLRDVRSSSQSHHPVLEPQPSVTPELTMGSDPRKQRQGSQSSEIEIPWSRSPTVERSHEEQEQIGSDDEELDRAIEAEEREMDTNLMLESNEWERFLIGLEDQERLAELRQEAELEVEELKRRRVKDRRDADDVNDQMRRDVQELLKLFGIPFIDSPMEAEAQCTELERLGLVDGIITDDSDVFLFGGRRVYKNLFNQNKFVESYRSKDLEVELGLNQTMLIQLAYLLGSDYTIGLNGVGPVTAMEILSEFDPQFSDSNPTPSSSLELHHHHQASKFRGLLNFKDWWKVVQVGKDSQLESGTAFRTKFRKKKDKIWIDDHWPDLAVAEAYLNPVVDHSNENLSWGLPDLDGIREFLYDRLSWSSIKTEEVVVPLIKRQNQRLSGLLPTQAILDDFFDRSVEGHRTATTAPPLGIQAGFSSQRLQKIVQNWRDRKQRLVRADSAPSTPDHDGGLITTPGSNVPGRRSGRAPGRRQKPHGESQESIGRAGADRRSVVGPKGRSSRRPPVATAPAPEPNEKRTRRGGRAKAGSGEKKGKKVDDRAGLDDDGDDDDDHDDEQEQEQEQEEEGRRSRTPEEARSHLARSPSHSSGREAGRRGSRTDITKRKDLRGRRPKV